MIKDQINKQALKKSKEGLDQYNSFLSLDVYT